MNCKLCAGESKPLYEKLFDDRYGYPGTFDLYQCSRCGFGQSVPELSAAALDQLYTKYYPRKNITVDSVRQAARFRPGRLFQFFSWLQGTRNVCQYYVQPGQRVLDVGCGDGASLLDITAAGAEAYGTEYDRNVEPIAQALGLKIFFGDVKAAPYADNWFDTITMSQLLEHVTDPVTFLQQAKQKLKPGGKIILSFPNIEGFNQHHSGRSWINWHVPYHINFFTKKSINRLAHTVGLELTVVRTYTPNLWLALQMMNNQTTTVEGRPSPVWSTDGTPRTWQRRLKFGLALLYSLMRIPLTRAQDTLGHGDSYLVILTNRGSKLN